MSSRSSNPATAPSLNENSIQIVNEKPSIVFSYMPFCVHSASEDNSIFYVLETTWRR